jgi:hypothetical protein
MLEVIFVQRIFYGCESEILANKIFHSESTPSLALILSQYLFSGFFYLVFKKVEHPELRFAKKTLTLKMLHYSFLPPVIPIFA